MPQEFSVTLEQIIKEMTLEISFTPKAPKDILIKNEDVNRPGLQLSGFYEYFDSKFKLWARQFACWNKCLEKRQAIANLFQNSLCYCDKKLEPFPGWCRKEIRCPSASFDSVNVLAS